MDGEVRWILLCRGSVAGLFPWSRIGEGPLGSRSAPGRAKMQQWRAHSPRLLRVGRFWKALQRVYFPRGGGGRRSPRAAITASPGE